MLAHGLFCIQKDGINMNLRRGERNGKVIEMNYTNKRYVLLIDGVQYKHTFMNKQNCEQVFYQLINGAGMGHLFETQS